MNSSSFFASLKKAIETVLMPRDRFFVLYLVDSFDHRTFVFWIYRLPASVAGYACRSLKSFPLYVVIHSEVPPVSVDCYPWSDSRRTGLFLLPRTDHRRFDFHRSVVQMTSATTSRTRPNSIVKALSIRQPWSVRHQNPSRLDPGSPKDRPAP